MAKNFKKLYDKLPEDSKKKIQKDVREAILSIRLSELRRAKELTQETIAKKMGIKQASVSKMENQADIYMSTLSHFIKAMGGELKVIARFPNGEEVEVIDFHGDKIESMEKGNE